ncbi:MAG: sigma-70 family RNA polymerase sigma factor [Lachnospiraceae bacterium]|nr:sigma-70 family RNA polymerase sigma factor [Lachnospiraceae bacterium]
MTEFEQIYKAYFSDVFLFLMKLSGNESVAEEITSETFFKAMRSVDKFRGDCDIRVWLCQIAKNSYYSFLKKQSNLADLDSLDELAIHQQADNVEEKLIAKDQAMQVHAHIHDLAEPYKEVLMLRVFGELNFSQIGQIFGKTENWACVTYHRARNKIKEKMEGRQ